jgi:hypothetical protein
MPGKTPGDPPPPKAAIYSKIATSHCLSRKRTRVRQPHGALVQRLQHHIILRTVTAEVLAQLLLFLTLLNFILKGIKDRHPDRGDWVIGLFKFLPSPLV